MDAERKSLGFWDVEVRDDRIVWVTRNAAPYETLDDVRAGFDQVLAEFAALDRSRYGLVIDVRGAPKPRNDDDFESVVMSYRPRLVGPFAAAVLLVRTAAGKMQLSRMGRASSNAVPVSDDPDEVVAYLREATAPFDGEVDGSER